MAKALGARLHTGESLGDRVIKVDHAGEHGAINIYKAQRFFAQWRAPELIEELEEFLAHEQKHRALFAAELSRRGRPRCRSYHLCGVGGMVLGTITGLVGGRAIHATTAAIERVVLRDLEEQQAVLEVSDPQAAEVIGEIVADEQAHHDKAERYLGIHRGLVERTVDSVVEIGTEMIIWLGMKL